MATLLSPRPSRPAPPRDPGRRPLALASGAAGLASSATVLLLLWVVALVGWYADDGGSHGSTLSALRVAADAWLLGHGASLHLGPVVVSASPLGLTLLCGWVTFRFGRWAGRTSQVGDLGSVGLGAVVVSGVYAATALAVSLLAATPRAEPGLGLAFVGGAVLGGAAGGAGLLSGSGMAGELRSRLPLPVLSAGCAGVASAVLLVAAGALLSAVALVLHASAAANVAESLALDVAGGALSLLLFLAILPNVSLLAAAYLLGPGFAVGTGTLVAPAQVTLGPVPAVPVLAALPPEGWTPAWASGLLAVPLVTALAGSLLAGRALPTVSWQQGAVRGVTGGAAGAVLLSLAVAAAGGAVGPGRMTQVGAAPGAVLLHALTSFALGGLAGGLVATWWARRRGVAAAVRTARLPDPPRVKPLIPGRPPRVPAGARPQPGPEAPGRAGKAPGAPQHGDEEATVNLGRGRRKRD